MKSNYEQSELIQENKRKAKMYEELSHRQEVDNASEWTPMDPGTDLDAGMTLYDMAKQGAAAAPPLSDLAVEEFRDRLIDFMIVHPSTYYMLLCNERKDYTIFHPNNIPLVQYKLREDLMECINNRGTFVEFEFQDEQGGVEIWIKDESGAAAAYYFFPYGEAVIEYDQ